MCKEMEVYCPHCHFKTSVKAKCLDKDGKYSEKSDKIFGYVSYYCKSCGKLITKSSEALKELQAINIESPFVKDCFMKDDIEVAYLMAAEYYDSQRFDEYLDDDGKLYRDPSGVFGYGYFSAMDALYKHVFGYVLTENFSTVDCWDPLTVLPKTTWNSDGKYAKSADSIVRYCIKLATKHAEKRKKLLQSWRDVGEAACPLCGLDGLLEEDRIEPKTYPFVDEGLLELLIKYRCPDCGATWLDRYAIKFLEKIDVQKGKKKNGKRD